MDNIFSKKVVALIVIWMLFLGALAIYATNKKEDSITNGTIKNEVTSNGKNSVDEENNILSPSQTDITVDYAGKEWITYGGDYFNRRYSTLDQINSENINELAPVWVTSLGSGIDFKYSGEATPLVQDGVMYVATGANNVSALDAKTGEQIWLYEPDIPQEMDTVCCGWTTRGVAIGDGKVYVGLLDARLVALDIKTGEVVWETKVAEWEKGYTITSAPLFYNDKVYTGVAGGEYGIRGRVMAYDSDYGREVWRFYTIPTPWERDGNTWPADNDSWLKGGAPVWNTPSVDPDLGYIYFATGNTAPDLDGSAREGDNYYANSVVAVNAESGEYVWHFQEVHHDIWDMDPANPVILYDVEMEGKMRKGLGQAGKTGWVYFLDRETGEPLVGIDEKEVPQEENQKTAKTQPFPKGDSFVPQSITQEDVDRDLDDTFEGTIGSIFTPFWDVPITLKPGPQGGANWPPSAYNPDTELFYVLGNDTYFSFSREDEEAWEEGSMYIGSIMQPVSDAPQRGTVTALDVKTNKIVWQKNWDTVAYSGVLTTKGNLVFVGHNDGRLIAFDAKTGDELWSYKMDAGANAPSITYEIDGEQYISIFAAGNALAGTVHGDKVYTFKLGGNLAEGTFTQAGKNGTTKPSVENGKIETTVTTSASVTDGLPLYKASCLACHGDAGANGHNGPNLQDSKVSDNYDAVLKQIKDGGTSMPSFKDILTDAEISAIAKYVNEVLAPMGK